MIRAVLFDVYGTIAGWSPSRYQLQRKACAAFGLGDAVTPEGILKGYATADAFMTAENASHPLRLRDKQGRDEFFGEYERLVLKGCGIDVDPDLALQIFNRLSEAPSSLAPFDDVVPTLGGTERARADPGTHFQHEHERLRPDEQSGAFQPRRFAVTSLEIRVEKPHPLAFQTALSRAGVEANEAVMVGDQPRSDIEGAARVGIAPILIDRDGNYPRYDASPRITTLDQLPPLIP